MLLEQNSTGQQARSAPANLARNLLLAIAVLWCIYWFVHSWNYWEDDAYIHLEFARSLSHGQGFAFNGRVVAGDTSPFWVFLLAGMHALIPDWLIAGKILTLLGAIVGLAGTYAFSRRLATYLPPSPSAAAFPAAMVLLVAANPFSCYWIFSGMEPVAAAGLAFFAVLAATREPPSTATFLTGCLLAGIAPLVRPEMIFLTGLLAFPLLRQFRRLPSKPAKAAIFLAGLLSIAAPVVLWSLYSLHAFGHLLPNTNAAKRANPADSVVRHLVSIYALGFPLILAGLIAGILFLLLRSSAVRRSLQDAARSIVQTSAATQTSGTFPLAGWIFILWPLIVTAFYIANHTYVQTRYILITAPGLTIVLVFLALLASPRIGRAVYIAALLVGAVVSVAIVRPFVRNKGINCLAIRDLALYMHDRIPPDAPVAVYAIGEIAFVSQHPIIDTGGITRPGVIPYLDQPLSAALRWAQSEGAQYFIGDRPQPNAVSVFSTRTRFIGWTIHLSRYQSTNPLDLWKLAPPTPAAEAIAKPPARP